MKSEFENYASGVASKYSPVLNDERVFFFYYHTSIVEDLQWTGQLIKSY